MDAKYLSEIKAREQNATPGPWEYSECASEIWSAASSTPYDNCDVAIGTEGEGIDISKADADFIVHARTDIPALVAEVEQLQQANAYANLLLDKQLERDKGQRKRITVLKKALELACERIERHETSYGVIVQSSKKEALINAFLRIAQEQEETTL